MPQHTPLQPFRDGLQNMYRSLRKEAGTRRDHLDRFIKDGNQYVLSRMERDGPKPSRNHLVNLFKRFEREEREPSVTSLRTLADDGERPEPESPAVEVVQPNRVADPVPPRRLGFWERWEYRRQLERARVLAKAEFSRDLVKAVGEQDDIVEIDGIKRTKGFVFPDTLLKRLDEREREVHTRFGLEPPPPRDKFRSR